MAKKAIATTSDFNARLIGFSTDLREYEGKKVLELSCEYEDLKTGKTFTPKAKNFPVFDATGLDFLIAVSKRAFDKADTEKKSFELYGEKGLIKTAQGNGQIGLAL